MLQIHLGKLQTHYGRWVHTNLGEFGTGIPLISIG